MWKIPENLAKRPRVDYTAHMKLIDDKYNHMLFADVYKLKLTFLSAENRIVVFQTLRVISDSQTFGQIHQKLTDHVVNSKFISYGHVSGLL